MNEPSRAARGLWLAVLLTAGAALRTYGIGWGLPDFVFFDTLLFYVRPAAALLAGGDWLPLRAIHPPAYSLLLAGAASVLPDDALAVAGFGPLLRLVLVGRVLTIAFSTASIAALYLLARRLVGTRGALLGAAAFALSPLHVLEAHRVHSDALMILLALLAAHQAVVARDSGRRGRLAVAFALAGLSGAVKYTGLVLGSVPAWTALGWPHQTLRGRLGLLVRGALLTLLAFLAGISPLFLYPDRLALGARRIFGVARSAGEASAFLGEYAWWFSRWAYPLVAALPYAMGWTVYLAALVGLALLCRVPSARGPVIAAVLPFFLLQGAAETGTPRYYLPLVPFLCLGAGYALDAAWRRRRALGIGLSVVVLGYTTLLTGSQCLRIDAGTERRVAQELRARALAARPRTRLVVVGAGHLRSLYDPIGVFLQSRRGIRTVSFPGRRRAETDDGYRRWLERERIDVVVISSWLDADARRGEASAWIRGFLVALRSGALGFEAVLDERTRYLTQDLYTWADPMFDTQPTAGLIGYEVFARARRPAGVAPRPKR